MYVYVCVCVCVGVGVGVGACVGAGVGRLICMSANAYVCVYLCLCMYVCMCVCVCVCACVCVCLCLVACAKKWQPTARLQHSKTRRCLEGAEPESGWGRGTAKGSPFGGSIGFQILNSISRQHDLIRLAFGGSKHQPVGERRCP